MIDPAWTASSLVGAYKARTLSPVEVIKATFTHIHALNPVLNAYLLLDEERAINAAIESERRWFASEPCGLLDGVPTSIKDALAVAEWPTRSGSRATSDEPEKHDCPVVSLLRGAGAIFLGKTTLPEFGFKSVTDSLLSGVTRNPWNPRLTAGGSSGGAAAAAATGMGVLHIGTDGGGSIRQPAGFCGVSGLKPSAGRVPNVPVGLYRSVLCTGPIARTVDDCTLALSVIGREDLRDPFSLPTPDYRSRRPTSLAGKKIAFIPSFGIKVDSEVATAVQAATAAFTELGATVDTLDCFWPSLHQVISVIVECHKDFNVQRFAPDKRKLIDPFYLEMAERGRNHTARDYTEALSGMDSFASLMGSFSQDYDAIVTPTMPILPFDAGECRPEGFDVIDWYELEYFLYPFSLSGQPAISVPCGLSRSGLPIGMQIVGRRIADIDLLAIASAFQTLIPAESRPSLT